MTFPWGMNYINFSQVQSLYGKYDSFLMGVNCIQERQVSVVSKKRPSFNIRPLPFGEKQERATAWDAVLFPKIKKIFKVIYVHLIYLSIRNCIMLSVDFPALCNVVPYHVSEDHFIMLWLHLILVFSWSADVDIVQLQSGVSLELVKSWTIHVSVG